MAIVVDPIVEDEVAGRLTVHEGSVVIVLDLAQVHSQEQSQLLVLCTDLAHNAEIRDGFQCRCLRYG